MLPRRWILMAMARVKCGLVRRAQQVMNEVKVRDYGFSASLSQSVPRKVSRQRASRMPSPDEGTFYCYEPHAIWSMFDVVMLTEPKNVRQIQDDPAIRLCKLERGVVCCLKGCAQAGAGCARTRLRVNSAISDFLANMKLDASDVSLFALKLLARAGARRRRQGMGCKQLSRVDGWLGM